MKILAIETSCDETAIAIVEASGDEKNASFKILGNALLSQVEKHAEYGGVFPALAKREHANNLVPILAAALEEAELLQEDKQEIAGAIRTKIAKILEREPGLEEQFFDLMGECEPPAIDAIAVTAGPGLEPALWVGINFAKALSLLWDTPLVAVNHMEGHVLAALARRCGREDGAENILEINDVKLPVLALLISGGHTELVAMNEWLKYSLIGQTRDDAVGEAYDKVARMLGLPYPGGPEVSRLSEELREHGGVSEIKLPRPMLTDTTCDFSFAGLKTAVLYLLKDMPEVSAPKKKEVAREFEDAVAEVLWKKTARALEQTVAKTLVIGGGVSANTHIRRIFKENVTKEFPDIDLKIPTAELTTDNAIMIALAGYYRALKKEFAEDIIADGNRSLG